MKVFFFYIGTPTPVLETELELVRKHERLGDIVRVMQCSGRLPNCHWNQEHSRAQCAACRSRFANGWSVLNPGAHVELRQFPPLDLDGIALPDAFESVEELKRFQHDCENIGFGVASGLISLLRDHRFDTRLHRVAVMRELRSAIQVYETLKREFHEFRPDRVYVFNGRIGTHLPAYLLCRRMGIEFVTYEVAGKPNSYRLLTNQTIHAPMSADEAARLRADWTDAHQQIAEGLLRRRRLGEHLAKIPVYTAEQIKGLLPAGFDATRRNVAIFNSTIDEYAGIEGWDNRIYEPDETAGVARILQAFEADPEFMFYLRVHPHMKEVAATTSQLQDVRALAARYRNLHVIWPQESIDSYALLGACEKTLTFGSTIGIEATYWGKPSILAGHAFYENLGCVYLPQSHKELVRMVREHLPPRPAESALVYFYWEATDGVPFTWFRETGMRNGLATGTFDGIEIKADLLPAVAHEAARFVKGACSALLQPSTALSRLRQYAKTIH